MLEVFGREHCGRDPAMIARVCELQGSFRMMATSMNADPRDSKYGSRS
jgi:hypothetical protein